MRHFSYSAKFLTLLLVVSVPHLAHAQDDSDFKYMEVKVVDPDGKPMPDVSVDIRIDGAEFPMPTDASGAVAFNVPSGDNTRLRVKVVRAGYAGMGREWDRGEVIPEQFTIPMQKGIVIGGIVHDEQGMPIEGAEVKGSIFWHTEKNELRPTLDDEVSVTDANGKWQLSSAPKSAVNLQFKITHPDYASGRGYSRHGWSWEQLQAQDQVYVLEKGIAIHGRVLDPSGQPIKGAKVALGSSRFDSQRQIIATNEAGEYQFSNLKAGQTIVTVSAADWAPDMRVVTTKPQTKNDPIDIQLQPPNTVRIRVLDPAGKPLPGVKIIPENWRGYRSLEDPFGRKPTNSEGIWEWHGAPSDEIQYSIFARGRFAVADSRSGFLPSDEVQDITMYPAAVVTGKVIDKVTRQPIENFKYVEGVWWNDGESDYVLQQTGGTKIGKNGNFQFELDSSCVKYLIRVTADGYRPSFSRAVLPEDGDVHFEFELEPSAGIQGVVKFSDGRPAERVDVLVATIEQGVYIYNGRVTQPERFPLAVTNAQGKYTIPAVEAGYKIVYLHEDGIAELTETEHGESAEVTLQPWARLEGQIMPSVKLGANGQAVLLDSNYSGHDQRTAKVGWYYREKVDAMGHFVFERVPSGSMVVGGNFSYGDSERLAYEYTHTQQVQLASDKTTKVQIGGSGRKIKGQLLKPIDFDGEIPWQLGIVKLTQQLDDGRANPPLLGPQTFATTISPEGSFVIEDVLPGQYKIHASIYTLSVNGNRWNMLARAEQSSTVPEVSANDKVSVVDLGEIQLKTPDQE